VSAPRLAYRVPAAAAQLGISERQTWRLVAAGELRTVRAGRATLIPHAALEAFLARGLQNEEAGGYQPPTPSEAGFYVRPQPQP
jgi:excisionase family DNA binding protein